MKKLTLIIFISVFTACQQKTKIENPNGIWTELEITELNLIISEFDEILTKEYKADSEKQSYLKFSSHTLKEMAVPDLNEFKILSNKLTDFEVFEKIWKKHSEIDTHKHVNTGKFQLNVKSNYLKYLTEIGKKSDFINGYAKRLELAEFIDASIIAGFVKNIKNIDLNDKNNRLIFAIHYLTLINE